MAEIIAFKQLFFNAKLMTFPRLLAQRDAGAGKHRPETAQSTPEPRPGIL